VEKYNLREKIPLLMEILHYEIGKFTAYMLELDNDVPEQIAKILNTGKKNEIGRFQDFFSYWLAGIYRDELFSSIERSSLGLEETEKVKKFIEDIKPPLR
jgi:hypothetical protein